MRLLFTIPDYWPYVRRGSERIVHDLAVTMAHRGHEITVVTGKPGALPVIRRNEGIEVQYRPRLGALKRMVGLNPLEGFAITAGLAALRHEADIYHAFYLSDAYGLTLAKQRRRKPVVFSWHGVPSADWWAKHEPRTHRWYLKLMRAADCVTVMTEVSARRLRDDYGYDPVVIAPGIFSDIYKRPQEPQESRTIVYSAAIDDTRKRHEVLIDAFEILGRDEPDIRLILVGEGDGTRLQAYIGSKPAAIASRVSLVPVMDNLAPLYARCTVGALTSMVEAFGLVVAEYLASGMPAVVSDDGGSPEIISEGTGLTFRQGDADDCANALSQAFALAADPATEERCRQRARVFDWAVRGDAYEELYARLA